MNAILRKLNANTTRSFAVMDARNQQSEPAPKPEPEYEEAAEVEVEEDHH